MTLKELEKIFTVTDSETIIKRLQNFKQTSPLSPNEVIYIRQEIRDPKIRSILEQWLVTSAKIEVPTGNNESTSTEVLDNYNYYSIKNSSEANIALKLFFGAFTKNVNMANFEYSAQLSKDIVDTLNKINKLDKKTIFSKYSALNDVENNLAEKIYYLKISPQQFAKLSGDEMKSENLLEKEKEFYQKGIFDSSIPKTVAETDLFYCFKCKQNKASYRQLQTRSADEPMTTYVFCICGNTWKF